MNTNPLRPVSNYDEVNVIHSNKNIDLLSKSIERSKFPSRGQHALTSIGLVSIVPAITITLLATPVYDILRMVGELLTKDQKLKRLGYNIVRIILLNPIYIPSKVIITIIQIASSFFGIILPQIAARGWLAAEYIELGNAKLYASIKTGIGIYDAMGEIIQINPTNAEYYLTSSIAKEIEHLTRDQLKEANLKEQFAELLMLYIEHCPNYFTYKFPDSCWTHLPHDPPKVDLTLDKQREKNRQVIDSYLARMTSEEIEVLFNRNHPYYHNFILNSGISQAENNNIHQNSSATLNAVKKDIYSLVGFGYITPVTPTGHQPI